MKDAAGIVRTNFLAGQGLGNQLWVYAAGRGIAAHLRRPHVVTGLELFKGAGFLEIDSADDPDPGAPVTPFNEALFYDPALKYFSATYDSRVEKLPPRAQIDGLFQSEKYFYGRTGDLADWVRPTEQLQRLSEKYADTCVLNLRGGEYKRHKSLILPRSYWDHAIACLRERVRADNILVVTDDRPYARAFLPEFEVLEGGVAECYAALMGAKALVVSNSSFSYFPIKTRRDVPLVIAPEHWARYGHAAKRWAMPSNFYEGWLYIGTDGRPCDPDACRNAAELDAQTYEVEYSVRVPADMGIGLPKTRHLPQWLKRPLKKMAARIAPTRIG
ncbi:hypothetical protein [Martelella limonii]|uniref:hypothetical protein n=1 Tax=Martelella limonii TaxID=1647649 RepID=UPI001580C5F1|nr:hypothetical protein [Martelella limonii]